MIDRRRATVWFVFLGLPILAGLAWVIGRAEPRGGRGLLIMDVPADVAVTVEGRALRPCDDEYHPHSGCSDAAVPGFSRRYAWSVLRERPVEVQASRREQNTTTTITAPASGPTPHLILDDAAFAWRRVGGTRMDGDTAVFVDDAGRVMGPVGHSEPD